MRIEVAVPPNTSTTERGDLLESLAGELMRAQQYEVEENVRVTATELDLLCRHRVNRRRVYVECKAYRDTLSANVFHNVLGKVQFHGYDEGWVVSTGPLGKDAKGFAADWESRDPATTKQLSIYTPERIVSALESAGVIGPCPVDQASSLCGGPEYVGDWVLLVSPFGRYWVVHRLIGGIPAIVHAFYAKSGRLVTEPDLLNNLSGTDCTFSDLEFSAPGPPAAHPSEASSNFRVEDLGEVVPVEHGETWHDYRPARPEDFVGRGGAQDRIIKLLEAVRTQSTSTRVFAITGDSGMGKSSLIAKLRDRVRNVRYRGRMFIYAVDVRAARSPRYMLLSLLQCLGEAVRAFEISSPSETQISDPLQPLESASVRQVLEALREREVIACLIFDQFEELYSKPELFSVFEGMQRLLLDAVAAQSNLVLGFAWKTDATVHQDHPAYHMWHRLADHRMQVHLGPFGAADASKAITIFERELGEKLRPTLRRQLGENSQGYPWLLKKLCIHVYDQVKSGVTQAELGDRALDVSSLFERDLNGLTAGERACLQLIAENAPADWYEILSASSADVLRSLVDKRLAIRSGDRVNVYWDIFREYLISGSAPHIALTFLPSSPSLSALMTVASRLKNSEPRSIEELAKAAGVSEKTAGNIVRDMVMFGIAQRQDGVVLDPALPSGDLPTVLSQLRKAMKRHALTARLESLPPGSVIHRAQIPTMLKELNPTAQHRQRTWEVYGEKMVRWLCAVGLLSPCDDGTFRLRQDAGGPRPDLVRRRSSGRRVFLADAPPERTVSALEWLMESGGRSHEEALAGGFRNAVYSLAALGLARRERNQHEPTTKEGVPAVDLVWEAARSDPTLALVREQFQADHSVESQEIALLLEDELGKDWSEASRVRIGNAMRRWAEWLESGTEGVPGTLSPDPSESEEYSQEEEVFEQLSLDFFGGNSESIE